jgi:hypothetical protein
MPCILQNILPLIYLLMVHHYGIIRAMRTKILDRRVLLSGVESFVNVKAAIRYRVNDLTSTSSVISLASCLAYIVDARRHLFTSKTQPGEGVPEFRLWNCRLSHVHSDLAPLSRRVHSSSISIARKIYGLQNMSELWIHQSYHPLAQTKTNFLGRERYRNMCLRMSCRLMTGFTTGIQLTILLHIIAMLSRP